MKTITTHGGYGRTWYDEESEVTAFWSYGQDGKTAYAFVYAGVDGTMQTHRGEREFEKTSSDSIEDGVVEVLERWLLSACGWVQTAIDDLANAEDLEREQN